MTNVKVAVRGKTRATDSVTRGGGEIDNRIMYDQKNQMCHKRMSISLSTHIVTYTWRSLLAKKECSNASRQLEGESDRMYAIQMVRTVYH